MDSAAVVVVVRFGDAVELERCHLLRAMTSHARLHISHAHISPALRHTRAKGDAYFFHPLS